MPDEPLIPPADVAIATRPPPPEIPIPEGLLAEPAGHRHPSDVSSVDAVVLRRHPRRVAVPTVHAPTPAILEGEPPAAVADDWSQPSVAARGADIRRLSRAHRRRDLRVPVRAPRRAAIIVGVYLLNTTTFPFARCRRGRHDGDHLRAAVPDPGRRRNSARVCVPADAEAPPMPRRRECRWPRRSRSRSRGPEGACRRGWARRGAP